MSLSAMTAPYRLPAPVSLTSDAPLLPLPAVPVPAAGAACWPADGCLWGAHIDASARRRM
jgi:hypothetical protein